METDDEFTKAYVQIPVKHCARVTVVSNSGERLAGETGGDQDDLSTPKTDAQIVEKFRGLAEDFLGAKRVNAALDSVWSLENMENVTAIPPAFVLD